MFTSERPIIQIAYAVRDVREAAAFWSKKYNIGPFYVNAVSYTHLTLPTILLV